MQPVKVATWREMPDREPIEALLDGVEHLTTFDRQMAPSTSVACGGVRP